jgi:radical SAM superfamily enzyme YgiQ (UPF0313 family)
MIDKQSVGPPLGLLTIAGMIPETYDMRVVDLNVRELQEADFDWADIVITSSMIIHWPSLEEVIARCNQHGVPVLNGGPLPTQYHAEIEGHAVFYLGEAENGFMDVVDQMVAGPKRFMTTRQYIDRRGQFLSLAETPLPRWDLIEFDHYANMVIQITRGCPESCTFCNIPSLYGKLTRLKDKSRIIQELDALYDAGWRGSVMAVDDNFVGNRDAIRLALTEEVIPWQKARGYPFQLFTQASVRVSDDLELLEAMHEAGFDKMFAGIESPVDESLKFMGARKNLQGGSSLIEKVRTIQRYGMEVQAGFIMGLDTDPDDIAERMIDFIREAGIPVAMVGILGVLRDTPDYKRFSRMGRLLESVKYSGDSGIFSRELSYVPLIDPEALLARHRYVVERLNSPEIFFERCRTHYQHRKRAPKSYMPVTMTEVKALFRSLWRQGVKKGYRREYWQFLGHMLRHHLTDFPDGIRLAIQGHHLILTTRAALQVDEVRSFLDEALDHLKRFSQGYSETFQLNVGDHVTTLMKSIHHRFENFHDDHRTLQHNASVLLRAAQEYCDLIREEFRHQLHGPLEGFQREIEGILEAYAKRGNWQATC